MHCALSCGGGVDVEVDYFRRHVVCQEDGIGLVRDIFAQTGHQISRTVAGFLEGVWGYTSYIALS